MIRLAVAAALAVATPSVSAPPPELTCPGPIIDYTFHGYYGPTRIVSCGTFGYNAGRLTVSAFDPDADGLFRNGFEATP